MKPVIMLEDFAKLDLRIGKIIECQKKEGSEKLLRLIVDFGNDGKRNILSGIAKYYSPDALLGKQFVFIFNLAPRMIMGENSEGMILATDNHHPMLLSALEEVPSGIAIR